MQLFGKSSVLYLWRERAILERSSSGPFCQKPLRVVIYPLGWVGQLPNYPSINHAHVFSSYACSSFLSSHLSAFALKLTHASHLFSQLCPLRAATSLSVVKVSLFFCHPLNLLPLLLLSLSSSTLIPLYFFFKKFYLSNLIWEIHFEGRVLINKTPNNTNLLPKTTRYQHWSVINFLHFNSRD